MNTYEEKRSLLLEMIAFAALDDILKNDEK